MSARRLPAVLTKKAREDYRQILLHSFLTWGERQQLAYNAALLRALELIGNNPHIGRAIDDVRPGYRAYPVEQHVLLYRIRGGRASVSRIIHSRMDARQALGKR